MFSSSVSRTTFAALVSSVQQAIHIAVGYHCVTYQSFTPFMLCFISYRDPGHVHMPPFMEDMEVFFIHGIDLAQLATTTC